MHSNTRYRKKPLLWAVWCLWAGLACNAAQAVTLNFSASIVQGTCSLSLDKSVLPLGEISQSRLRSGALVNLQPFTLTASNCSGATGGSQQPVIVVNGAGRTQDGKWLFRSDESDAGGAGVMLVQSATPPSYGDSAVKTGDVFPLAAAGQAPVDRELPFYAGISCGGSGGCATVKPGALTAHIVFQFAYR
ncbi:fimbrial protein [Serratia fonticola]|uniref:fimbrial protein n=1 Tax=Serratia fonticola TaxID=47917 RepID=UPI0021793524|nr:fimbrial protein [Serratia fonticola]CAI1937498.1 putative fimbrial protein SthA [Serratia fonticola]